MKFCELCKRNVRSLHRPGKRRQQHEFFFEPSEQFLEHRCERSAISHREFARNGFGNSSKPRIGPRSAQDIFVERPGLSAEFCCFFAAGERMFEQSEERHGCKLFRRGLGKQGKKDQWWSLRERHTGRIVDRNVPAREFCSDTPRKPTIGSNKRRSLARLFDGLTQHQGDGERLFAGMCGGNNADALQPFRNFVPSALRKRAPGIGCRRGPHHRKSVHP